MRTAVMCDVLAAAGFPDWQVDGLIEDYAHYDVREEAAVVTTDIMRIDGRPPLSFDNFARDYVEAFA